MAESAIEATTTNGPSLESILWAAAERWSDDPGLVDRDEFADYIFSAWGYSESPTEEFISRFFDGDPTIARPNDMAEAVARASRNIMHVYNFDLNHLEYVVIDNDDEVVLVSEAGQFSLPADDYLRRTIEKAIIPDSKNAVGSNGEFDRKSDGTPRAYWVKKSGEIVAVDVDAISRAVSQMQLDLKPVFSPVIDDADDRLAPFNPVRTQLAPNKEPALLRQDERISSWMMPPPRKRLVSSPLEMAMGNTAAAAMAAGGLMVPKSADTSVLLLLPDGTMARPVIGSGSRWRDMVSDWTARAAMISLDATVSPQAVLDDRRYAIQTDRVVAVFSGVRPEGSMTSDAAPGEVGLTSQTRSEALAAVRMMDANIRILGDDDIAQAILGGAQIVSGLAAPLMADTRPGTGFWMQPEIYFQPTDTDRDFASREMDLRSAGITNAALESALQAPQGEVVAGGDAAVAGDPWSNWALQTGGEIAPGSVAAALIGRDVDGGTVGPVADPSALALFARKNRNLGSGADAQGTAGVTGLDGGPIRIPSERVLAFRAPDGAIVFQPQANTQVRLASVHRSIGAADDTAVTASGASVSEAAATALAAPRTFSPSIAARTGALPATALAALATALDRTAASSGYKLPRSLSFESAPDALDVGDSISSDISEFSPRRSQAMLADLPMLTGNGRVGQMVLSMPFPSSGEVVVGQDLDEALQAWMAAPAISVGDASAAAYGSPYGFNGAGTGAFGGAASGAIAGGLALRGSDGAALTSAGLPATYTGPMASLSAAPLVSSAMPGGAFPGTSAAGTAAIDPATGAPVAGSSFAGGAPALTADAVGNGSFGNFGTGAVPATGGTSYSGGAIGSPALVAGSSGGASYGAVPSAVAFAGGAAGGDQVASLHNAALAQAQNASLVFNMPAAAGTLSSRAALARMPKLLSRALDASGGWIPGAGTPLPLGVQEFALSGPFELPELASLGSLGGFGELDGVGPDLISTRVLNPGEEEIQIPMPLWTQMGRGRLSSTDAVMASPRMRPGFAPPLGVYRLVAPDTVDFTGGAPENTPGVIELQGPTELGLDRSWAGGVEANKLGGSFVLGHVPVADGETAVGRRGRIRIGAPLGSQGGSSSSPDFASFGQAGSFATGGTPGFGAGDLTAGSSSSSLSAQAYGGSSSGELVSGASGNAMRVPGIPDIQVTDVSPDLESASLAPSSSGRPFAGALRAALRMSDDVGGRVLPGSSAAAGFSTNAYQGASWAPASSFGSNSLVAGQPMLGSGGGIASGAMGPSFGGGTSSLVAGAPQGAVVSGGSSAGGSAFSQGGMVGGFGGGDYAGSANLVSGGMAGSGGSISGLPPGAWSGQTRDDGSYTSWTYGSRYGSPEQSRGGVDMWSGSRLNKPNYPALPAMLRFRYIGAPLWWSSATGSWASGRDSADGSNQAEAMGSALKSGLGAANSAAMIWRSIFVNPSRQDGPGSGGGGVASGSDAGAMDQTWDRNADSMASLSSKMALIAVGTGGGSAQAAMASTASLTGPETVYVAMDSRGRAGTTSGLGRGSPDEVSMKIVAAIPPSPPPLADMAAASSTGEAIRPRHAKAQAGHGEEKGGEGEGGVSRSKIEGSVDAIAQRIYHRIVRRLDEDRERFGS